MRTRWLIFIASITACAGAEAEVEAVPSGVPTTGDAGGDAGSVVEAGACDDCAFFPEACTADALCANGPFDPGTAGGAFDARTQINVLRGRSASDIWAAGALGALAHFDGTSWTRSDPGTRETMVGLWIRETTEIALVAPTPLVWEQRIYVRDPVSPDAGSPTSAGGWSRFIAAHPPIESESIAAWGALGAEWSWITLETRAGESWNSGVLRMRRVSSTTFEIAPGPASPCLPGCNRMNAVHGASANDIWAVGANGTTMRVADADGDTPSVTLYDSRTWNSLHGVWAASDVDAWSVGASATVRHYTGKRREWDVVAGIPTTVHLNAVHGSSPSDVWAVGDSGVVLHYDGSAWSRVGIAGLGARRPRLTTVWVAAPGHVWVGGDGVVFSLGGKP